MQINPKDIEGLADLHEGDRLFRSALEASRQVPDRLLTILARYIHFNSVFGGGVANLAGEIAVRKEMFLDPGEEISLIRDRSVSVAAAVFAAAVDEFGDTGTVARFTHRVLAQATLKFCAEFFSCTPEDLALLNIVSQEVLWAMRDVEAGYLLNQQVGDEEIFRGIGFHMSSEILADHEFRILDDHLLKHRSDLVEYLKTSPIVVDGDKVPGYRWIQIHTSVEADHFAFAVRAANIALRYYRDQRNVAQAKQWVLQGFARFAEVQRDFLASIAA